MIFNNFEPILARAQAASRVLHLFPLLFLFFWIEIYQWGFDPQRNEWIWKRSAKEEGLYKKLNKNEKLRRTLSLTNNRTAMHVEYF